MNTNTELKENGSKDLQKKSNVSSIKILSLTFPVILDDMLRDWLGHRHKSEKNNKKRKNNLLPIPPNSHQVNGFDGFAAFLRIFNSKDGKDKVIKMIHYTLKLVLWADSHTRLRQAVGVGKSAAASRNEKTKNNRALLNKTFVYLVLMRWIQVFAKELSMFRQILRFGNWMEPLHALRGIATKGICDNKSRTVLIDNLIELYNAVFDDFYLIAKMGLTNKSFPGLGTFADTQVNYAWMASIILGLNRERRKMIEQGREYTKMYDTETSGNQDKEINLQKLAVSRSELDYARKNSLLTVSKLFCDFIFCGLELAPFGSKVTPLIPTTAGLMSAFLGYYKMYIREYQTCIDSKN